MKPCVFSSVLSNEMTGFLALRASQGISNKNHSILISLDEHLVNEGIVEKVLAPRVVDDWVSKWNHALNPNTTRNYIGYYTKFAKYLQSLGVQAFIPDRPMPDRSYLPYVFTETEMDDIFRAADNMKMKRPSLTVIQFPMLLRLLYGCGLRLGEALRLQAFDIDTINGVLMIRSGKGNRDRIVPIERTLSDTLSLYCNAVITERGDSQFIFAGAKGGARSFAWALQTFQRILMEAKIDLLSLPAHGRNICLHCLRHTFAVNAFRKLTLHGIDSYSAYPFLSVYLGHYKLAGTQTYLHLTDENSADIIQVTSQYAKGMFPEVPL